MPAIDAAPDSASNGGKASIQTIAKGGSLSVAGYGGYQWMTFNTHTSNSSYDYGEDVAIVFDRNVNLASFKTHYSISPSAANSPYLINGGRTVAITVRKVPGTTYTLSVQPGVLASDGTTLASAVTDLFTTPATVSIPQPSQSTNDPYRYGIAEHPWSGSLGGSATERSQQISLLANIHARFVRMDYVASDIEFNKGKFNFTKEDAILDSLFNHGITELPIIEQYSAPTWATGGDPYPAIFVNPADFATFAGAVASHLHSIYPHITRMEIFNEPNDPGWWENANPVYASTDGSAAAVYDKAAYAAIKAADPSMIVVAPALGEGGNDTDPRSYLQEMYASGCRMGTCWDVLSVHNYAWVDPTYISNPQEVARWNIYQDLQKIAQANGDPIPHIMLTEWAFSTDATTSTGFDPNVQALFMAKGFNLMLADPTIDGIVWTNLYAPGTDFWSLTSLTNPAFSQLPGFAVFRNFATF